MRMALETMNAVTIYEMNGIKYTGAQKIYIASHPRFLSFVRLCIDDQEYSLSSDDLMRAVDCAVGRPLTPGDKGLLSGARSSAMKSTEESSAAQHDNPEEPPR